MKILISNDDGYQAPGIQYLAEVLSDIADIIIVAPDRNRSGASNSLTLTNPMRVTQVRKDVYYVNGTPTDCVHLAITGLLEELPDMVVSGINDGENLGDDILYSGTVAAAIEGRSLGLPSIAFSLAHDAKHFETAAMVAKNLVLKAKNGHLPSNTILNVNIPDVAISELGSYEVTRLGRRHRAQSSIRQMDPRGREIFWAGLPGEGQDAGEGTDFYAIRMGNVSITPLRVEWTDFEAFEKVSKWAQELDKTKKSK